MSSKVILDNYCNDVKLYIVISEHKSFEEKFQNDFILNKKSTVVFLNYSSKKIRINSWKDFFIILKYFFEKTIVISEYYNFVPRLVSIFSNSFSLSIIYGVLTENNFNISYSFRLKFLKKLLTPLYADQFIIVNRQYSYELLKKYFFKQTIDFININRKFKNTFIDSKNYCLWISQCWEEDGHFEIEKFQKECISKIIAFHDLIIVKHPREKNNKYLNQVVLDSLNNAVQYCELNGSPKYVYGISSSALLEFKDYDMKVFKFENSFVRDFNSNNVDLMEIKTLTFSELHTTINVN